MLQLEPTTWAIDVIIACNLKIIGSASMSYVNLIYHMVFSLKIASLLLPRNTNLKSSIHRWDD